MKELTINLNINSKEPLYEQIYHYIKNAIRDGKIPVTEKLPSTRALASHLQVSRSTAEMAYVQLVSEGYIESIPCRGYFVCDIDNLYLNEIHNSNQEKKSVAPSKSREWDFDFSPNGIDLDNFPFNIWRKITRNTLIDDNKELFQLGEGKGDPGLRNEICEYLYQSRGVNCQPHQIILGAGNDYLLMILSRIIGTNHIIAMEDPTYRQAYRTFQSLGYQVNNIQLDKSGMDVHKLRECDSNIAYVMPSHQYPLGIVMPIKRRMELLNWATERANRYIIEDDYDSEFRYIGKPIPALQGYDKKGRVIYLGTLSKSIAPAIRVSYMVLPEELIEAYEKKASFFSNTVSRIDQTILEEFIKSGAYERHLNRMRSIYRSKRDTLLEEMKCFSEICDISGEQGGVHILVHFKNGMSEQEILKKAADHGIRLYGLSNYYMNSDFNEYKNTILMGYATLNENQIREAVKRLKNVLC